MHFVNTFGVDLGALGHFLEKGSKNVAKIREMGIQNKDIFNDTFRFLWPSSSILEGMIYIFSFESWRTDLMSLHNVHPVYTFSMNN